MNSPSKEIRFLYNMAKNDPRSTTCTNIKHLESLTSIKKIHQASSQMMKLRLMKQEVPINQTWMLALLDSVYTKLTNKKISNDKLLQIDEFIASLCSS